jgi:hypothetical protein
MKSIKIALVGLLAVPILALSMAVAQPVSASDLTDGADAAQGSSVKNVCMFTSKSCKTGVFTTIVNVALFLIGAISVIMIIYGGIRYTISGGDAKNVTAAKDTILYAIVGLVVAILAYAVVNFVITKLT